MKRSAILAAAALVVTWTPCGVAAQTPPPPATPKSVDQQVEDMNARVKANAEARLAAERKCDLAAYRALVAEALANLNASNRLLDLSFKDSSSDYKAAQASNVTARQNYDHALFALNYLERRCPQGAGETGGVGTGDSATPPAEQFAVPDSDSALNNLFYYYRWAQIRYGAHSQAAANCDVAEMEKQRSLLSSLVYPAKVERERAQQRFRRGKYSLEDVNQAKAYEQAIQALYLQALAQVPMNCRKTGKAIETPRPQPPPPLQPPASLGQKNVTPNVPGGMVPQKTGPEFGMAVPPQGAFGELLGRINRERAGRNVTAVRWNPRFAAGAQEAARMLSTNSADHSPPEIRIAFGSNIYENNASTRTGLGSPLGLSGRWFAEKLFFIGGPQLCSTGAWSKCVHYARIVSPESEQVGCGYASGAWRDIIVCWWRNRSGKKDGATMGAFPPVTKQPAQPPPMPIPYPPPPLPDSGAAGMGLLHP